MPTALIVAVDGAARGNPGPAGAGVVLTEAKGQKTREIGVYLGETTNNVAEYAALVVALYEATRLGAGAVQVQTDSELLAKQVSGEYRVKEATLRMLHALVRHFMAGFGRCTVSHVPREQNRAADRVANRAVDAGLRGHHARACRAPAAASPTQRTFPFPLP